MSLPSRGKVHFVYLTDPAKGSAISSHRAAKSHAARHGHARIRRQRMNEYQQEGSKHEGGSQVLSTAAISTASSAGPSRSGPVRDSHSRSNDNRGGMGPSCDILLQSPRASQPSILEPSPLSSVTKNIESLYGTRVNWTQQFLIHHCKHTNQLSAVLRMVCLDFLGIDVAYTRQTLALLFLLANAIASNTRTPKYGNNSCSPSCSLSP
jgi:hypothetical protein